MSAIKKLAGQTAIYGLSSIAGRSVNFFLVPLFTRVFTDIEYGINSEFYAYLSFLNILITHGMETAFFRFSKEEQPERVLSQGFISILTFSLPFLLLVLPFSHSISAWMGYAGKAEYIQFTVGILLLDAFAALPFAWLREKNMALRFAVIKNLGILINVGLSLYLVVFCPYWYKQHGTILPLWHPEQGITGIFLANFLASAITLLLLIPELRRIKLSIDTKLWNKLLLYSLPLLWVGLAGMVNETLDRVLLRWIWPNQEEAIAMNGIYAANYKLSIIISLFIQSYKFAAEPFFFSHARQTDKRDIYAIVMNYFVAICLFVFIMVTSFLFLFQHFIGEEFREGIGVVPVLLGANIFLGMYYNVSVWYKLSDNTKKGAKISILGAIITIVLNIAFIPKFGYVACAYTTLICYFTMLLVGYLWGRKYYPIPYNLNRIILYFAVAFGIYLLTSYSLNWFEPNTAAGWLLRLAGLVGFTGVVYQMERKSFNTLSHES